MGSVSTLLSWGAEGWLDDIAFGVLVTVGLAVATLPVGLVAGFFVALTVPLARYTDWLQRRWREREREGAL